MVPSKCMGSVSSLKSAVSGTSRAACRAATEMSLSATMSGADKIVLSEERM